MKHRRQEKLKIQADYCVPGRTLDTGFSANPNPYLVDAVGLDLALPTEKPPSYREMITCNFNCDAIPAPDASFENVIAGDVIEHLENPSHFLREINRVLVPGGRLILSTPQANDWWTTLHNWFFRRWINDPDQGEHLQNWTILDMIRLLKKNGFTIERLEGLYMRFPKIPVLIRMRRFPILCWQVYYIAKKTSAPNGKILTCVNGVWNAVEQ